MRTDLLICFVISISIIIFFMMNWIYACIYFAGAVSGMYYLDEHIKYKSNKFALRGNDE